MRATNHSGELVLPQYQLITVKSEHDGKMGSRVKDLVYLSIILLLGISVWSSYSKENREIDDDWPWSEHQHAVDLEEDLLQIDGHIDAGDYDHLNVNSDDDFRGSDDGGNEVDFNIHDAFNVDTESQQVGQPQHLPLQEDIVHGENHEIESSEDMAELVPSNQVIDGAPEYNRQFPGQSWDSPASHPVLPETGIAGFGQIPSNPLDQPQTGPDTNEKVVSIAKQVLETHANIETGGERTNSGAINTNSEPGTVGAASEGQVIHAFLTEDKPRPRLVFRSHTVRDVSDDDNTKPKIPRIIHQSWESSDIPMDFAKWVSSWLEKNPGWEYWFWTPSDVQILIEKSYPQYASTFRDDVSLENRANVMRYFIVHAHGGVYAELDMECLNNIDTWIFSHGCFLAEDTREHSYLVHNILTGTVINAIMACRPHHPFYEVILHALPDYIARFPNDAQHASGSFFLDEIFRAFKKHPLPASLAQYGDVALVEPDYFIPSYDQKHWSAIDKACNSNIADMPFHVSWLCTLWIRKRMHENQPYKHSYTDHHWTDIAEIGSGNIATIPITVIIQSVIAGGGLPSLPKADVPRPESMLSLDTGSQQINVAPLQENQYPSIPSDAGAPPAPHYPQLGPIDINLPRIPPAPSQEPENSDPFPGAQTNILSQNLVPKLPEKNNLLGSNAQGVYPQGPGQAQPQQQGLAPVLPPQLYASPQSQPSQQQQLGGFAAPPADQQHGALPVDDTKQYIPVIPPDTRQPPLPNIPQQYP